MKRHLIIAALVIALACALLLLLKTPTPQNQRQTAAATAPVPVPDNPPSPDAPAIPDTPLPLKIPTRIRIAALGQRPVPLAALSGEPWKLREEWRQLSTSFLEIGNIFQHGGALPSEIEFPLFDGHTVTLANLKFVAQNSSHKGVIFAHVKDEPGGGHVMFSYVNHSTVGVIHIPSQNAHYEINNATPDDGPDSQIYLAQLDSAKLPVCGICAGHAPEPPLEPTVP